MSLFLVKNNLQCCRQINQFWRCQGVFWFFYQIVSVPLYSLPPSYHSCPLQLPSKNQFSFPPFRPLTPPPAAIIIYSGIAAPAPPLPPPPAPQIKEEKRQTAAATMLIYGGEALVPHTEEPAPPTLKFDADVSERGRQEEDGVAGGAQYIGSGIFYPWGVSISAPSAGSDITCCNSAGGIIDLSTGSRHRPHHSAVAAGEGTASGLDSVLLL